MLLQFFDKVDEDAQTAAELDDDLEKAIKAEDYAEARELKQQLDAIIAKDAVNAVMEVRLGAPNLHDPPPRAQGVLLTWQLPTCCCHGNGQHNIMPFFLVFWVMVG